MKPDILQAALQFLMRVPLRGEEAPVFNAVVHALQSALQNQASGVEDTRP